LNRAIQRQNRSLSLSGFSHLDERKPAGLTSVAILNNCDTLYRDVSREKGSQLVFTASEIEVAYKNVFKTLRP
jgi:hypothetical protein